MRDVVRAILKSLGVKLEDVAIRITHVELSNRVYRIDNIYSMMFVYENRRIEINLAKLGTKDMSIALFNYDDDDDGVIVDHHVQELADITTEELYKIIKEFINIEI